MTPHLEDSVILKPGEYIYHEERVAAIRSRKPDQTIIDIGLLPALLQKLGMTQETFGVWFLSREVDIPEGASKLYATFPDGRKVALYCLRMGDRLEIGDHDVKPGNATDEGWTRIWLKLCQLLDEADTGKAVTL